MARSGVGENIFAMMIPKTPKTISRNTAKSRTYNETQETRCVGGVTGLTS